MSDSACVFQTFFRQQGMYAPPVFILKMKALGKKHSHEIGATDCSFLVSRSKCCQDSMLAQEKADLKSTLAHIRGPKADLVDFLLFAAHLSQTASACSISSHSVLVCLRCHTGSWRVLAPPCHAHTACSSSAEAPPHCSPQPAASDLCGSRMVGWFCSAVFVCQQTSIPDSESNLDQNCLSHCSTEIFSEASWEQVDKQDTEVQTESLQITYCSGRRGRSSSLRLSTPCARVPPLATFRSPPALSSVSVNPLLSMGTWWSQG